VFRTSFGEFNGGFVPHALANAAIAKRKKRMKIKSCEDVGVGAKVWFWPATLSS